MTRPLLRTENEKAQTAIGIICDTVHDILSERIPAKQFTVSLFRIKQGEFGCQIKHHNDLPSLAFPPDPIDKYLMLDSLRENLRMLLVRRAIVSADLSDLRIDVCPTRYRAIDTLISSQLIPRPTPLHPSMREFSQTTRGL